MSLDLDASILITEVAQIASLIQRMGRCNRKSEIPEGQIGYIYVLRREQGKDKPYGKRDPDAAVKFIDSIAGRPISQAQLEAAYSIHDPSKVEPDHHCPFLDSGPFADGDEETFRDIEEFTVPCILDTDLSEAQRRLAAKPRLPIDGFVVPVPKRQADYDARPSGSNFPRWLFVAPADHYDPLFRFQDHPLHRTDGGQAL